MAKRPAKKAADPGVREALAALHGAHGGQLETEEQVAGDRLVIRARWTGPASVERLIGELQTTFPGCEARALATHIQLAIDAGASPQD